ncbi:DUF3408 domain-containing protein [bacterium]|nr:MAG: DUF3408 domain-containing protein [bacterium]
MSKDKKTSSFSASSLVADALKLKKEKPSIGEILEKQNEKPVYDEEELKALPSDLIEQEQKDSLLIKSISSQEIASSEDIDQAIVRNNVIKNHGLYTQSGRVTHDKENTSGIANLDDSIRTKNFTDLKVNELENVSAKRKKQSSSLDRYLIPNRNVQKGKAVYVRTDYHTKIDKIVSSIGEKNLTIAAYIDNILTAHFEQFNDEIDKKQQEVLIAELETLNKK